MARLNTTITVEMERRPVLVNVEGDRQILGYFHKWNEEWIALIEDPFSGKMFTADLHDIVFMDRDPYSMEVWEYIYNENLRLIEERKEMQKYDIKDILLEVLAYKSYSRDWWGTRDEWIVIISALGSSKKLDWTLNFEGKDVYDGMEIPFMNNTFHIWFDFYDYDGPKDSKEHIDEYLNKCERYIFKPINTPSKKATATAWFKPCRKNFSAFNERS